MSIDAKQFYDRRMPEKYGRSYERGRWERSALERAQYAMMERLMRSSVLPFMAKADAVLEVGPGPGTWTKFLREKNPQADYTLVDISSVMLDQARAALSGSVTFVEADWSAFTPAQSYHFFFSSRAIEYVNDKSRAIATVEHALAPGGRGVIITKTPKHLFDVVRGRKSRLHTGQIAPRDLKKMLRDQGLVVCVVRTATATVPGIQSARLNKLAFWVLSRLPLVPLFSESYAVFFKKP